MKQKIIGSILSACGLILLVQNLDKYKAKQDLVLARWDSDATYWPNIIIGLSVLTILIGIDIFHINTKSILSKYWGAYWKKRVAAK